MMMGAFPEGRSDDHTSETSTNTTGRLFAYNIFFYTSMAKPLLIKHTTHTIIMHKSSIDTDR